jgi:hypothetical protein
MPFSFFEWFSIVFIHLAESIGILESFGGTSPDGLGSALPSTEFGGGAV